MIKLVLPDHPDRTKKLVQDAIGKQIDLSLGYMPSIRTEITHNGDPGTTECWDIDVYVQEGGWSVRIKDLSREEVDTKDMLMELMLADNGTASDWIRTLIGQPDLDGIWDAYRELTS